MIFKFFNSNSKRPDILAKLEASSYQNSAKIYYKVDTGQEHDAPASDPKPPPDQPLDLDLEPEQTQNQYLYLIQNGFKLITL